MTSQILVLTGRFPGLNDMILASGSFGPTGAGRKRWRAYATLKRGVAAKVIAECVRQRIRPIARASVHFHWCEENRRRDPDNIRGAGKMILDSLVEAGVLPDDGWDEISGLSDTFEVCDAARVVVTLTPEIA